LSEPNPIAQESGSLADIVDPILGILSRRRWTILSIAVTITLGTVAALYRLPNRYTSEATLFVVEQQIPQRYVTPTSTTELEEALPAMTQEVLSRNRLLELVEQFDLYPKQRHHLAPEEIETLVHKDLSIEPLPPAPGHRESNAFKISFMAPKAILAQEVTSRLTTLFIQENLRTREDQARHTAEFLHTQTETAKEKLAQQEEVVRDFKTKNLGELPEQQQGNLSILNGAELQLQNIEANIDRAQQQRAYLQLLLDEQQRLVARARTMPGGVLPDRTRPISPYDAALTDLNRMQTERTKLVSTLRPTHPDVVTLDRQIAAVQASIQALKASAETSVASSAGNALAAQPQPEPEDREEANAIAQLKGQLESNRLEIANLTKDSDREKAMIEDYQSRLNLSPVREQQLAGIVRDYDLSKKDYEDLLSKEQQSELAMSLEKQQGGEQFRLVDPPSLPALPSSPKRLKISFGGVGGGLALGLVIAFLLELKKGAFYKEREITKKYSVPLVVGLPLLVTPKQKRRRSVVRFFEWCAGTVVVAMIVTAEVWVYGHP